MTRAIEMTDPTKPKDEGRSIPGIIATAITIAGFAVLLSTQRQQLSFPEQLIYALVIGTSAIAFSVWVWYRPISRYLSERSFATREDNISRESLGTFQSYGERLRTMCS